MADAAPAELRAKVLDRIDDVDLEDLFLCTRVLALTALDAAF
jgi:hypothetical protein